MAGVRDTVARQGASLQPLLQARSVPWRSSVLIEYYSDEELGRMVTKGYQAVRTERDNGHRYAEPPGLVER